MHQVYVELIVNAILEQYFSEESYYKEQLQLTKKHWQDWKKGQQNLNNEEMQKIKNLFTDYEWMLMQKVLRQTLLFPEKRQIAVAEYKQLKTLIAKKWLQTEIGIAELLPSNLHDQEQNHTFIRLKVALPYGEWGFDDILTFRLPAKLQPQLEGSKVALLDWLKENLEETYVNE